MGKGLELRFWGSRFGWDTKGAKVQGCVFRPHPGEEVLRAHFEEKAENQLGGLDAVLLRHGRDGHVAVITQLDFPL